MIILASASPRRSELLRGMGITEFEARPSRREEPYDFSAHVRDAVERIALGKALDVSAGAGEDDIVIGADTLVFLDGAPLGKPADAEDAKRMLRALSGREHRVITGVAVLRGKVRLVSSRVTYVRFRRLTDSEIDWYVSTGEPMDKAGAYGIQGLGAMLVSGIRGDYGNVVGLPVSTLARMLKKAGFNVFQKGENT